MQSIENIQKDIYDKEISVVSIVENCISNIENKSKKLNCFREIHKKYSIKRAQEIDQLITHKSKHLPLAGVTFAIKDTIAMKHGTITAGSKILEGYQSPFNATVIKKIEDAGAIIVATANCDEFAMGSSGETCAWGPCLNPHDETRVPGGSSSGSAAAVAGNLVTASLGTDTGGSIRQPAAFCGVVGYKPTYGGVSRYGLIGFAPSFDQIGPITASVDDARKILSVISGYDSNDATTLDNFSITPNQRLSNIKSKPLILPKEWRNTGNQEIDNIIDNAVNRFESSGFSVKERSIPILQHAIDAYYVLGPAEASSNLARFDGIRYGKRETNKSVEKIYLQSRTNGFGDEVKRRIMLGTYVLSSGYYKAYYDRAMRVRRLIRDSLCSVLKDAQAIIGPTTPEPAFKFNSKQDPLSMYLTDLYTVPANLAGLPAISIPCGILPETKLPAGLQLVGPPQEDDALLALAAHLEHLMQ